MVDTDKLKDILRRQGPIGRDLSDFHDDTQGGGSSGGGSGGGSSGGSYGGGGSSGGGSGPITTEPSEPEPEPEIIQKDIPIYKNQWVHVRWESPFGETKTTLTKASSIKGFFDKGYHVVSVSTYEGDVFYKAPSSSEWSDIMTGYYQREYKESGFIPLDVFKELKSKVPADVKFLGLEDKYIRSSYEQGLGIFDRQESLIGPSLSPSMSFERTYKTAFESLPDVKQFEYGLKFGSIKDEPMMKWKQYEGGLEYIKGHKEETIKSFVDKKGGWENINMDLHKYASKGGLWSGKKPDDPSLLKEHVWEKLTLTAGERRQKYFSVLPAPVRWYSSGFHATVSATLFPVTLSQTGIKYARGKGSLLDPIGRIQSGETFGPDVSLGLSMVSPGGPSGLISTGISEGVAWGTGGESDAWERFEGDPVSGAFATGGEIFGLYMGGKALHVGKVGAIRGLGKIRGGIVSKTGWNLPTYASYMKYRPSNIVRTLWWKGKEKLGRAKYLPEEQVWDKAVLSGSKKFAEVPGAGQQLKVFESTRSLTGSGDIATIHASPYRFGRISFLKKGTSESPGLSVSSFGRGSPHFLQTTGYSGLGYETSGLSLLPKLKLPTGPITYLKKVFRLPKNIRKSSYDVTGKYILKQPRGQYGWIAPKSELGGPELEAIIRGGTFMGRKSSYYYTTYKGSIIPLPEYNILHTGMPSGFNVSSKIPTSVKSFFSISSSGGPVSIPILRPGYLFSSMGSYKSSYPVSSSTGSFTSSSIMSVPSSKGFSIPSSVYKPSISSGPSIPSSPSSPSIPSSPSVPSIPSYSSPSSPSSGLSPVFPSGPSYPKFLFYPSGGKRRKQKRSSIPFGVGYKFRLFELTKGKYVSPFAQKRNQRRKD